MPLNSYATRVRSAVLETLPRLAPYMEETQSGALRIRVPHPRISSGLVITTEDDEMTIGFRSWHTHGELLGGTSSDEHVLRALEFVEQLLEGNVQVVISTVDGEFNDAWVTDDPLKEHRYVQPHEQLLIGTWSDLAA